MFGKFYLILKELVYFHFQNIISLWHIRHYLWRENQFKLCILPSLYIKILAKYFDCSNSASWKTAWIWLIINSCTFFVFRDFLSEKKHCDQSTTTMTDRLHGVKYYLSISVSVSMYLFFIWICVPSTLC